LHGQKAEFDVLLQSAVDDALMTLGESVKQAIYFHIENGFNVPKNNVFENIETFKVGLERIFGAGARFIEIMIMKNLHSKIGLSLEIEGDELDFVKYINAAQESYDKTVTVSLAEEVSLPIE